MTPFASTVGVKVRPTPNFLYSTVIVVASACDRDRELAAGEEARLLARQRDEVRLGEAARQAALFERLHEDVRIDAAREHASDQRAERRVAGGEGRRARDCAEVLARRLPVDAEILAGVARGLDEAHLEHDLLGPAHLQVVEDVGAVLPGERHGLGGGDRVRHLARENRAAVGGFDPGGAGSPHGEIGGEPGRVVGDLDLDHADELLRGVVDRDVGGADLLAEDIDGLIGERHHVGCLGIADDEIDEAAWSAGSGICRARRGRRRPGSRRSPRAGSGPPPARAPPRGAWWSRGCGAATASASAPLWKRRGARAPNRQDPPAASSPTPSSVAPSPCGSEALLHAVLVRDRRGPRRKSTVKGNRGIAGCSKPNLSRSRAGR